MYEACQNSSGICADLKDLSILIVKIWALGEDFNLLVNSQLRLLPF